MTLDDRTQAALARLTDNEKTCLRRRLLPETAKEMAIVLGISPHAVEKRLKMARTKLGVSSSLEAARMLAASETGYQQQVPQSSDLDPDEAPATTPWQPARMWQAALLGVVLMSLLIVTLFALAPQSAPPPQSAPAAISDSVPIESVKFRAASPGELRAFLADSFATMDRDGSGFIERAEAPASGIGMGKPHVAGEKPRKGEPVTWIRGKMGQAMWISRLDTDDDGKLGVAEYVAGSLPIFEKRGVPANWTPRS